MGATRPATTGPVGATRPATTGPVGATHPATTGDRIRTLHGLPVVVWDRLDGLGVDAVVTTRHGGVSTGPFRALNLGLHVGDDGGRVVENRRRAAATLGADLDDLVLANQVHGTAAAVVSARDRGGGRSLGGTVADADVLVTTTPGLVVATLVADCVPVLLYAPASGVLAVAHAGWRGTVGRVLDAALAAMTSCGAAVPDVRAALGPAIGGRSYEVGPEVAEAVRAAFPDPAPDLLGPSPSGRWWCDLGAANRRALLEAGVPAGNVLASSMSTGGGGPFFSDRAVRPCGRFGLLARIRPRSP